MPEIELGRLTPRARAGLAAAAAIASSCGCAHIGAEHLLAALLRLDGVYGRASDAESAAAALALATSLERALADPAYRSAIEKAAAAGAEASEPSTTPEPDVRLRRDEIGNWRFVLPDQPG